MKAAALSSLGIGHCPQDQWTQKIYSLLSRVVPTLAIILTYHLEVYTAYIFWHSSWHILWHSFWHSIWHQFWHTFWHVCLSGILPGIYSAILFGSLFLHSIWHLFWHSFLPLYPTFYSGILFGIYSDILSDMGTPGRQLRAPDLIFPSMSLNLCPKPGLRQRGASVSRSRRTVDEYVIVLMLTDKPPCVQNKMANNF